MPATSALPRPDARAAFRACVVAAIRDGEAMMAALAAEAGGVLEAQAPLAREPRRRDALEGARHLLAQHAPALVRAYPMALLEIFAGADPDARAKPSEPAGLDFGELSLMDEAEVIAQVELSRAQLTALHATEAVLAELDALVSAAQGLPRVQPDRNPLRPENYIRALQQVVGATGVAPDVRALWMAPLRDALATQLKAAYRDAADRLRADGVEPVGYAVAASPGRRDRIREGHPDYGMPAPHGHGLAHGPLQGHGGRVPSTYAATGWGGTAPAWPLPEASQPPLGPEAEEALLTVAMLRQMLTQPLAAMASAPVAAGLSAAAALLPHTGTLSALAGLPPGGIPLMAVPQNSGLATAAAEAMEDIAELERIVGRLSGSLPAPLVSTGSMAFAVPTPGAAPAAARPRSRTASEVVSRMMDNIAQDDRLLPPVQRSLQELRPALQRLVRHDPRFFSNDQHPARRLLDALTQRALAFDSEDADDFTGFARLMEHAVAGVNAGDTRSADTFATALAELEAGWSVQDRRRREREEDARAVALELTRREELARRVSADIRALARTEDLPADIVEFAAGPWADVVARAQADLPGEDDPGGCLAAVTELFWLAQPTLAARTPERLAPIATRVLGTLRDGLERIGHDPRMTAAVLERVAGLRQAAAEQAALQGGPADARDSEAPDTGGTLLPYAEGTAGLSPGIPGTGTAASSAGDDGASAPVPESASAPTSGLPGAAAGAPAAEGASGGGAELSIGTWVELVTHHRTVQTQLTWASPHHTLFLFTALDGSTQSMTRRVRDKHVADGALRVLPGPPAGRAKSTGARGGTPPKPPKPRT